MEKVKDGTCCMGVEKAIFVVIASSRGLTLSRTTGFAHLSRRILLHFISLSVAFKSRLGR